MRTTLSFYSAVFDATEILRLPDHGQPFYIGLK